MVDLPMTYQSKQARPFAMLCVVLSALSLGIVAFSPDAGLLAAGVLLLVVAVDLLWRKRLIAEETGITLPGYLGRRSIDWSAVADVEADPRRPYRLVIVERANGELKRVTRHLGPSFRARRADNLEVTAGIARELVALRDEHLRS